MGRTSKKEGIHANCIGRNAFTCYTAGTNAALHSSHVLQLLSVSALGDHTASLSFTISRSLLRFVSVDS